jgi:hypothetical protein
LSGTKKVKLLKRSGEKEEEEDGDKWLICKNHFFFLTPDNIPNVPSLLGCVVEEHWCRSGLPGEVADAVERGVPPLEDGGDNEAVADRRGGGRKRRSWTGGAEICAAVDDVVDEVMVRPILVDAAAAAAATAAATAGLGMVIVGGAWEELPWSTTVDDEGNILIG